jgi:murein DD-endopeptidase MepM/ murein hydrolase activator NlpD/muramidase (phage lysozyme)/phage FluMu protein gp41
MSTQQAAVSLQSFGEVWETGKTLLALRVTLGLDDKASLATATLSDPDGAIAARLIDHSLNNGGLAALPEDKPAAPGQPASVPQGGGSADTTITPARRAFLDTIAWAEGTYTEPDNGYRTIVGYSYFTDYSAHPAQYVPSADSDAAGRYQFLSTTYAEMGQPDFSPESQDRAAIRKIDQRGGLGYVDAGQIEQAITACAFEWASFPGNDYGQPKRSMAELVGFYNKRLATYQTGVPGGAPIAATPTAAPAPTATGQPTAVKGGMLLVSSGAYTWEFLHTRTEATHEGVTTLTGQSVRALLNKRQHTRAEAETTLQALAEKVCTDAGIELDWQAAINPSYAYVHSQGLTDYQLLHRECQETGLILGEAGGKLTVRDLSQLQDTDLVLRPGLNLLSWAVKDEAVKPSDGGAGSASLSSEAKATVAPATGAITPTPAAKGDPAVGSPAPTPTATVTPGTAQAQAAGRSRVKRLKGLPSTFTTPLDGVSLGMQPMQAIRTQGLAGVLNRIWAVDRVIHDWNTGETTLDVFSPIDVPDNSPAVAAGTAPTGGTVTWGYPVAGFPVTDVRRPRSATRFHHGIDVGTPIGTPVYAMADGTVAFAAFASGYGLVLYVNTADGYQYRLAHLDSFVVRAGQTVTRGQLVAYSGDTGVGTGAHLHAEIRLPPGETGESTDWSAVGLKDYAVGEPMGG